MTFSLFLFVPFLLIQQTHGQSKLQVEVLYESLCPDSLNFVTQQLYPSFRDLSPYINLKLTPFGKSASVQNGADFVCQHGPQECKGNKIQSCVLNAIQDQNAQVEYVNCFMKIFRKGQRHEQEFGQTCAEGVGINLNDLSNCYTSDLGVKLQLIEEQRTARITPKFVPTILYNNEFNQQLQDLSLTDFRGVVCGLISQTYPEACQRPSVIQL